VRDASLALIAVVCSLYPAVTILLSFGLLREPLGPRRLVGIGVALFAVALIATG
jgi:drug/metabolite transporter (DMT)-like permease